MSTASTRGLVILVISTAIPGPGRAATAPGAETPARLIERLRAADAKADDAELACTYPQQRSTLLGMLLTEAAMLVMLPADHDHRAELEALLRRNGLPDLAGGMDTESVFGGEWAFGERGATALAKVDAVRLLGKLRQLVAMLMKRPGGLLHLPDPAELVLRDDRAWIPGHGDVAVLAEGRWFYLPVPTMPGGGPPEASQPTKVGSEWAVPDEP